MLRFSIVALIVPPENTMVSEVAGVSEPIEMVTSPPVTVRTPFSSELEPPSTVKAPIEAAHAGDGAEHSMENAHVSAHSHAPSRLTLNQSVSDPPPDGSSRS